MDPFIKLASKPCWTPVGKMNPKGGPGLNNLREIIPEVYNTTYSFSKTYQLTFLKNTCMN